MRIKVDMRTMVDNTPALRKALRRLSGYEVLVGYLEGDAPQRKDTPLPLAAIAYIQDRGSPAANIPPRPFLETGVRSVQKEIGQQLKRAAIAAVEGNEEGVVKGLHSAGLTAQAGVRKYMTTATFTPLAAATLAARRRKGFMGTRPLLVTGQLRAGVNYAVGRRRRVKPPLPGI